MDYNKLDSSEQEIAVQLFRLGLKSISEELVDANNKYRVAQEALKIIELSRNDIVVKYNTIISLISKAGGEVSKKEADLVNLDSSSHEKAQGSLTIVQRYLKALNEQALNDKTARPTIRSEVIEVLRTANRLLTANEVLNIIRKTNPTIPDSTVTSAISVQYNAGNLGRHSAANGTNLYGLPEWFSNGQPKEEYFEHRQMSI